MEENTIYPLVAILLIAAIIGWFYLKGKIGTQIIYEFQAGLLYENGKFIKVFAPGKYSYWKVNSSFTIIDTRRNFVVIPSQDILTQDNANIKLSLVCSFQIIDPIKATHSTNNYYSELYNSCQMALRDLVSNYSLDSLLENRTELDAKLLEKGLEIGAPLGLDISMLAVKDIMLPANLKRAYSGILEAKKEAQIKLEAARGEQAVLRSLANSGKLLESNPQLLQVRLIQALGNGANTIVFNTDGKPIVK